MPTPYQFTPRIPSAPHPTPGSDYKLPLVKSTRRPAQNPYDKFTQPEFDAWIGGITIALKRALGQEEDEELARPDKRDLTKFIRTQPNVLDDANELSDDHIDDSFAEVKARRTVSKGKARDPREGPGFGKGDSANPIDLVSSDEEEAEEVELSIALGDNFESDEEGSLSGGDEYSWERGQESSPLAPSPSPKISEYERDEREEEEYGSEEYEDEETSGQRGAQYDGYDADEYYDDDDDAEEEDPQVSHSEVIDVSSDDDEIEEDISESEQPARKIRKLSPQRHVEEEGELSWSDGEGETDEGSEVEELRRENTGEKSARRVQGKLEQPQSPEVINLDSDEEGQPDEGEGEGSGLQDENSNREITRTHPKRNDAQQGDDEDFSDGHDDLYEGDGEDGVEEEGEGDEDDAAASQIPLSHDRPSAVHSQHDRHELSEVFDVDDEIQEVQPMENDTSFPPKQSTSPPFESNLPEIPDPWSGPRTYAEDYYSGGDVKTPLRETVNAHHLGPNDDDSTPNLILDRDLEDAVVQPVAANTAFPPSEDQQTSAEISDPWKGPQLYAEDFYSGGPVHHPGSLTTAHYLGPMDVDNLSDLTHDAVTQESHMNDGVQPQGTDTSFSGGLEESESVVDIADPWFGPQTYAEDFYSGGDVRTLPGVPIDPALLSGTGDIEDDIDNFLTPGALTPSQTNTPNDIEGEEEHEIIQPPGPQRPPYPLHTSGDMPLPEDADIIAIDDSGEEQGLLAMPDELDELDELDEDDNLSLQYPDFDNNHQPLGIIQEDRLDSNEVIVPPLQLNEGEKPDVDALNRQFQYDSDNRFGLETPLAESISVTIHPIEEVAEKETELTTTSQPKNQERVEIWPVDDCQDNSIPKDDEFEALLNDSSQMVENDSLTEEQPTTTVVLDSQGDFEMHSVLQDNAAIEDLAKESSTTNIESAVDENNTVKTTDPTAAEQASGDSAGLIDQELDEEGIPSPPGVHDTGSQDLHPPSAVLVAAPVVVSSFPQTSGQLPTPPSEGGRYVSLPPESHDEPSGEMAQPATDAAAVPVEVNELSQPSDSVETMDHTVLEPPDEDTEAENGAGEDFDTADDDDVEIRTAYTGEDADHVLFSVEEPMTEGRPTEEPSEGQLSPSEQTVTVGLDEDMESSQVPPPNDRFELEVSLSQDVGTDSLENTSDPDIDETSKASRDEDDNLVPMPDNILDPVYQPITSNISTATQVIPSASALDFVDTSATPLAALGPSVADVEPNSQILPEFAQQSLNELATSNDLTQTLESDRSTSVANISTPTADVFGMLPSPFVSNPDSTPGLDGQAQYLGTTSLPYRAPSTSTRVVLTRKPTDPVLMADPYPYCLSTPDILPYTQEPGEQSSGNLDSGTTNPQIDQGMTNNEAGPDAGLLTQPTSSEPRSDVFAATTAEGSPAVGGSQPRLPTRKRKRKSPSAKSRQGSIVEAGASVAELAQEGSAKETLSNGKKRTKERKSNNLNKSSSRSSKKKVTGNIPETTSYETILVNPRMEERLAAPATAIAPTQGESTADSSAAPASRIFPPANNLSVVSPAPSHRSFTSQPSPTVSKPNLLPHPNAISESLLHAHGQKRKAMLSQAISPRSQTKKSQLFRFPSTPMIMSGQPSSSTSAISPIDTTRLPVTASAAASPTDVASTAVPAKPVTPVQKANSIPARQPSRSTPVTRSHCRYHRISLPKEEGGPRVSFLVPGCSLNDKELMDEEEIVDHGDATVDDSRNMLKDVETLGFSLDLIGVLRQLVGLDILREQEIFYLPQPGEVVTRRYSHQKSSSIVRLPGDGSSYAGSPGYPSYLMASPGPSRPPHSASSWSESPSLSSLLRHPAIVAGSDHAGTEKGYASTEGGFDTESDFTNEEDPNEKDIKQSPSDPTTSKPKGKQTKSKGRKGVDLTYKPDEDHDDEESDAPTTTTTTRKRRKPTRGTKRNRESDAVPIGDDGHERDAKKPKTEADTPQEPLTLVHPQNTTI